MDDDLIDDAGRPLSRYTRLPGAGFFYPDSLDEQRAATRDRETIEGADAIVIADGDADGLACAAMIRAAHDAALDPEPFERALTEEATDGVGDGATAADGATEAVDVTTNVDAADDPTEDAHTWSSVGLLPAGPYALDTALERVAAHADAGVDVYVCDLCPDDYEPIADSLESLAGTAASVRWFDHHQWDSAVAEAVRDVGVDLVVGASDEECTADVTLRSLATDFEKRWHELATVTRDHDLWIKTDPRSDDLADFSYWSGSETYVALVGAYGPDLPPSVDDYLESRRVEKAARIDAAVDRAVVHEVGAWSVGVTYGRCSQNEVAERLREAGADAAVIVKPAGSASIRGSETFQHAHEVAGRVNGGGHPQAAGCKPDIYDDMLDYATHWTTDGEACKRVILAAFEAVAEAVQAAGEPGNGETEHSGSNDAE